MSPLSQSRLQRACIALLALGVLSGCERDMSDLDQYIDQVKARPAAPIDPIPQMKPYEPYSYARQNQTSPFTAFAQDEPAALADAKPSNTGLRPDFSRNREPLEEFPLDGIRMLGTLDFRQQRFALLSAPDGVVHRATHGDHLGQNFGQIVAISDAQVRLEEIVPDGLGGYVKRAAVVAISEQ